MTQGDLPRWDLLIETFTNGEFLELETLGPITRLAPGETVEHVERWSLHKNVKIGSWNDAELDRVLPPAPHGPAKSAANCSNLNSRAAGGAVPANLSPPDR